MEDLNKTTMYDKYYNFSGQQVSQNQQITLDPNCNGMTVINVGSTIAEVNGIALNPGVPGISAGESFSIGGNRGELLDGRVNVTFVGGAGNVIVIQKFYLQKC